VQNKKDPDLVIRGFLSKQKTHTTNIVGVKNAGAKLMPMKEGWG